jgi:8-oxo-dGTP pyrophosphatase MutT (NUDIX family)
MQIKNFSEYMTESKGHRDTAGIAIKYDGKILLVHPANGSWVRPIMGIPKGKIESGEDVLEAAIRETVEETGIKIRPDQLEPAVKTVEVWDVNGKYRNSIHYFECKISELSEIGLDSLAVPKNQLQPSEVDWAGFVNVKEAYSKISRAQLLILDRLS